MSPHREIFVNKSVLTLVMVSFCLPALFVGCSKEPDEADSGKIVLYSALGAKVRGLDPGDIGDTTSSSIGSQFFECLYQYHYLKRPYELIPFLAEDMPVASENGLTYTIKIKHGVYFHDDESFDGGKGRELKAGDFIYSWKRIANIGYRSKNWWVFDGRVTGLDAFREYTKQCKKEKVEVDYDRPVEGLSAPDDYTLVIKLTKPWPQIIYMLAHQPTAPVAREVVERYGKDIATHPVGTGPYVLDVWHRGSYIKVRRNENYREDYYPESGDPGDVESGYLDDAGKPLPIPDAVVWTFIEEDQPRWLQFMRGKIDATSIPKDNFSQVVDISRGLTDEMRARGIELKTFPDPSTFWIGFNMEDLLLGNNKPLRKALSYAIDREKSIELFRNNRDQIAFGFIPPLMKAYDPDVKKYGISYDRQKAIEFAKEAEKVNGGPLPTIKFSMAGTDTVSRQMGQFYVRCFKNAGLDVEVEFTDWPTFQDKVKTKSAQMFSLGWIADYPDTENFLQLFYSKNASPGPNNFNYSNPEFDKLYEKVAVMHESDERTELYRQAERMIIKDCPAAFTSHRVAYVLHHSWVKNYKPNVFQYGLAKYRNIDLQKRADYKVNR